MFKCTECGQEFEIKPDYCDCGNDVFENSAIAQSVTENIQYTDEGFVKEDVPKENCSFSVNSGGNIYANKALNVQQVVTPKIPVVEEIEYSKTSISSKRVLTLADIISWGIFFTCIILSVLVILFLWNPKPQLDTAAKTTNQVKTTEKTIPNINDIWIESTPVVKEEKPIVQKTEKTISIVQKKPIATLVKKVQNATPKKATKSTQTTKVTKQTTKKTTNSTTKTTTANSTTKPVTKQSVQQVAKKIQPVEQNKPVVDPQVEKQKLYDYKIALRNNIASKINFAGVIGDGACVVSFKIDASGKLTNRSFTRQSNNDSLNDVVYAAMMSTSAFNPPPSGYKNETLRLNVKIVGGNFEVSLN